MLTRCCPRFYEQSARSAFWQLCIACTALSLRRVQALIEQQIKVEFGDKLKIKQEDVKFNGHAIECRINAENPKTMLPSPGLITDYHAASGPGIRVDSHIYSGYRVPHQYDSLIAKVIAHGDDRHHVIHRLKNALMEMIIEGVSTNTSLHCDILDDPRFQSENISIHFLKEFIGC